MSASRAAGVRWGSRVEVGPRVVRGGVDRARRVRWKRERVVMEVRAMRGMFELVGSGRALRRQCTRWDMLRWLAWRKEEIGERDEKGE